MRMDGYHGAVLPDVWSMDQCESLDSRFLLYETLTESGWLKLLWNFNNTETHLLTFTNTGPQQIGNFIKKITLYCKYLDKPFYKGLYNSMKPDLQEQSRSTRKKKKKIKIWR